MAKAFSITLPWPPTANTYWRRSGGRYFISKRGQDFRQLTMKACYIINEAFSADSRLKVSIEAFPPDKRKRDLDNLFKAVLDALQFAEIYSDDNQIDALEIRRMPTLDSKIIVHIEQIV